MSIKKIKTIEFANPSKLLPLRLYQVTFDDGRVERYRVHIASAHYGVVTLRFIPAAESEILALHTTRAVDVRVVDETPVSPWRVVRAAYAIAGRFI
jgi:hypothetical protein